MQRSWPRKTRKLVQANGSCPRTVTCAKETKNSRSSCGVGACGHTPHQTSHQSTVGHTPVQTRTRSGTRPSRRAARHAAYTSGHGRGHRRTHKHTLWDTTVHMRTRHGTRPVHTRTRFGTHPYTRGQSTGDIRSAGRNSMWVRRSDLPRVLRVEVGEGDMMRSPPMPQAVNMSDKS